jgi:cohesin complex subunit SA-1/2
MEVSSPAAEMATSTSTATRRKSDRVSKAPEVFGAFSKRKRNDINGDDVDGEDASDASSDDDEEPDPEELKEKRRRARAAPKAKAPAKKKAKSVSINGDAVSLPIRPTKSAPKSAPKRRKPQQATAADAENAGGLYGERLRYP